MSARRVSTERTRLHAHKRRQIYRSVESTNKTTEIMSSVTKEACFFNFHVKKKKNERIQAIFLKERVKSDTFTFTTMRSERFESLDCATT